MTVLAYLWKIITIKIKVGSWINHAELFEALGDNSLCSKEWMECYPFIFSRIIFSSFSCVSPKAFNVHLILVITLWLNSMQHIPCSDSNSTKILIKKDGTPTKGYAPSSLFIPLTCLTIPSNQIFAQYAVAATTHSLPQNYYQKLTWVQGHVTSGHLKRENTCKHSYFTWHLSLLRHFMQQGKIRKWVVI